jgi:phosphatidylinositol alpha-1,6-mannosyltransferase
VVAAAPANAPDLPVRAIGLSLADRIAYRPLWRLHPALHYLVRFWRPTVRAIGVWRPSVLQAGHVYLAPLARLLGRRLGLPFVLYAYGQEVWRGGRSMGKRGLDERLRGEALRAADAVLSPGDFTRGLLAEWDVDPKRIACVPYGAAPRPLLESPTGSTLLSVGRLVPRKGFDTVVRALPMLSAEVEYRVVGTGPDEARLRQLAQHHGVAERVRFLGRLDDEALADEFKRCALFVQPSRRTDDGQLEGYGLVYFEAAAWGRPVLAGRSGGELDAVVDGRTGRIVDGDSVEEVAEAIGELLADPDRLQALGAAGRRRVETSHNWAQAAAVVDRTLWRLA